MIGLFVLYIILNMRSHAKLLDLLDELAFPSDDPIMTSSLKDSVFEYEEPKEAAEEAVELTPEEEEVIEEVMAKEEPEVYNYKGYKLVFDDTRCRGINKSGRQCGRTPKAGELYCNQHKE